MSSHSSLFTFSSGDAFLNVLDKYTNLGIYIITHTFTLAELFTVRPRLPN